MSKECGNLLSYIAEELDEKTKKAFVEHLPLCPECTREYDQMTEAWSSLKWDFEDMEAPASLKSEVMDFVFDQDPKASVKKVKWGRFIRRQFTPAVSVIMLASLFLIIALVYSNNQLKKELVAMSPLIEVPTTLLLQSTGDTNTDGAALIVQHGEVRSLVIQIRNLPSLQGSEVYQVWLLKDGERSNAGVFKPDETGAGVLTYSLAQNEQFDQIGITKEPDANGTEPRGKKVIGSL
ncbi:anti-sigma factor [Bacillus sp. FSL K6-3431]|uniref:anti-sigma factor n=1 Tax=Bacillus sp. FSL K6-3431 TaxID=2921500 RepID=UPI0030F8C5F9